MGDDIIGDGESVVRADDVGRRKPRPRARHIIGFVLIGLLVLVAVLNFDLTSVDLLFRKIKLPLIVVIGASGAVGFAIGWLLSRRRERRRRGP